MSFSLYHISMSIDTAIALILCVQPFLQECFIADLLVPWFLLLSSFQECFLSHGSRRDRLCKHVTIIEEKNKKKGIYT